MNQLRIGIDGYNLAMRHGTGVATYGMVLAQVLKHAGHRVEGVFGLDVGRDPALREVMFFDLLAREEPKNKTRAQVRREAARLFREAVPPIRRPRAYDVPLSDQVEKGAFSHRLPAFDRLVSSARLFEIAHAHFQYHGRFIRLRMDNPPPIMHWTYPVPVELEGSRNIYTMHDLVPLRLPYTTLDVKKSYFAVVRKCAERAAHICTVSEASRRDIISSLGVDPARVTNTYQASLMPPDVLHADAADDAAMVEGIFGLQQRGFFLFFGAIEPKKNVGRMIEAYLSTRTQTPLVIVGARAWQSEDELKLAGGGMGQRIVRLDYLPRPLLLRLIRTARAVLFPSLYEGFGLPVLEAMQLGTPVLTSQTSALIEVAGDAAVMVDPYNVNSIAAGLEALDSDEQLRTRLQTSGLTQAALFSEARYRERLEQMYHRVLGQGV
ncbi:MAG: glycosyl transferase, group 1 [Sphingomonas bacterium]|nr:glycosyl transferase, group 1 [Sphingomonas bacterium]